MILIDGSAGEGGGQVLRSALGLSLVSLKPVTITDIRGKRKQPGLKRQHLTAVLAAAQIGGADVRGATIGSREIVFVPKNIRPGKYHFAIGTAGSCTLVFQAILPALLVAGGPSELILEGGTHNPMAPPFDFLETTFVPLLRKMGVGLEVRLERPGFYPGGGGRIVFSLIPPARLAPLELSCRTNTAVSAKALCAQLPRHIARRELRVVRTRLKVDEQCLEEVHLDNCGPGNVLTIFVRSDELTETFTGFGQKKLSAEKVADKVVKEVGEYLKSPAPVGPYLADQLLVPMALAGRGTFTTTRLSSHAVTNIQVIEQFCDVVFTARKLERNSVEISL